jgi:hypothetical protein
VAAEGLAFPNGMEVLDGGATLGVAESFGNRLSAFTVGSDGTLAARRDWARVGPMPASDDLPSVLAEVAVVPDGICAAPDGTVQVADADHHRAIRVAEGGTIVEGSAPASCRWTPARWADRTGAPCSCAPLRRSPSTNGWAPGRPSCWPWRSEAAGREPSAEPGQHGGLGHVAQASAEWCGTSTM